MKQQIIETKLKRMTRLVESIVNILKNDYQDDSYQDINELKNALLIISTVMNTQKKIVLESDDIEQ